MAYQFGGMGGGQLVSNNQAVEAPYLGNGLPTTLGHGIKREYTLGPWFEASFGMPINEFREILHVIEGQNRSIDGQIGQLRTDIKDKSDKDDTRFGLLRDIVLGGGDGPGIDGRVRSLEADRDRLKNRVNLIVGGFIALIVAVASGVIPLLAHAIVKLLQ